MNTHSECDSSTDWRALLTNLKSDDPKGEEELDRAFSGGVRFFLNRSLGSIHLETRVRETLLIVKAAIKADECKPEALASLVRTIVQKQVVKHGNGDEGKGWAQSVKPRGTCPAEKNIHLENAAHVARILNSRTQEDREALSRFYLHGQPQKIICDEMQLNEKDFESMKVEVRESFYKAIATRGGKS